MRTLRAIAALHLLAWSQTLQVLGGALLPGARPKNRAARVVRLVERELKPGEKLQAPAFSEDEIEQARALDRQRQGRRDG